MTRRIATCPLVERARRQANFSAVVNSGVSSAMTRNLRWLMGGRCGASGAGASSGRPEADLLLDRGGEGRGELAGLGRANRQDAVDLGRVGQVAAHALAHRPELLHGEVRELRLEGPEP